MHDLIAQLMLLYRVNFGEDRSSNFGGEQANNGNCAETRLQFDDRRPFIMLVELE